MAETPILNDLVDLSNPVAVVQTVNANNDAIEAAFGDVLSLTGVLPNSMQAPLDMNSNRLINLPPPQSGSDAARYQDIIAGTAITGNTVVPSLTGHSGQFLGTDGVSLVWQTSGIGNMLGSNNLSDLTNPSTARANLGLGSVVTYTTGTSGGTVPLLNQSITWSEAVNYTGLNSWSAGGVFSGTVELQLTYTGLSSLSATSAGYRGCPLNLQNSNYTLVLDDAGKMVQHTSGSAITWTIPLNSSIAFPIGTTIILVNLGSGVVTLAPASGVTLQIAGTTTTGNRSLNQWTKASMLLVATNQWLISGAGVS